MIELINQLISEIYIMKSVAFYARDNKMVALE